MNGLNPGGMAGSFDSAGLQQNQIQFNDLSFGSLNDYEKKELLMKVTDYQVSEDVKYFAQEYEKVFNMRNQFLWKWLGVVYGDTGVTLSTVKDQYFKSATDSKIILTMAFSILDDVSEVTKDEELLNKIINIIKNPDAEINENDEKTSFFKEIWNHFITTLRSYPCYNEYKDIFWYDFEQMINSVRYNMLVNKKPEMINLQDMHNYDCHNMIVFLLNGIDLMASPGFNKKDLPHIRKAFWHAQQMARIGNWLSTWKREVKEQDFCSGVFAYAFEKQIIDADEIKKLGDDKIIEKIEQSDMKKHFLNIWMENYGKLASLKEQIQSVNMESYLIGLQNVIKYHMASEGLK